MQYRIIKTITMSLALSLLLGCSDSEESSATPTGGGNSAPQTMTGQLVDSPVVGMSYECSSEHSGLTNDNGEFTCNEDDNITFIFGTQQFGPIPVQTIITPQMLFPGDSVAALNFAQLLQTLDSDGDLSNGISLPEDLLEQLDISSLDFSADDFEATVQAQLPAGVTLVSEEDAQQHLDETFATLGIDGGTTGGSDGGTDNGDDSNTSGGGTDGGDGGGGVVLDTTAPTFTNTATATINENSTSVLSITTDDATATLSLSGTDAAKFELNGTLLRFKSAPDYENDPHTYNVTLTATDTAGNSATQNITVNIADVDESVPDTVAPAFTSAATVTVAENQTAVMNIITDESATFTLGGTDAAAFSIGTNGILVFKSAPDYETKNSYLLSVTATDDAGNHNTQEITVTLTDVDEIAPTFTSSATPSVNENQTAVLQITTDDGAATLVLSGTDAAAFELASDGTLTFKSAPDFETKSSYALSVTATDGANNETVQNITVTILDLDEVAPTFTSSATPSVNENQTAVITVSTNEAATFTLGGTDAAAFSIGANDGVLIFNSAPDFETKNSYQISVTATDDMGNSGLQNITITILDVDEIAPTFTSSATPSVNENQTAVLQITTDDGAATLVLSGTDAAAFELASDGTLTFKSAPDFETKSSYALSVTATDGANNETVQNITVTILDLDEVAPTFTSSATPSVNENQTAVITVSTNEAATFTLGGTDAAAFSIGANDGVLIFNSAPDFEADPHSYSLTVTAKDAANNTATQNIAITLLDVDEVAPVFTSSNVLNANETIKYVGDITTDEPATLSLGGTDATLFTMVSNSLVFKDLHDYESDPHSYTLTVTATDDLGNVSSQNLTINLTNENDNNPVIDAFNNRYYVPEGTTEITTLSAQDADGDTVTFDFKDTDTSIFNLNTATGEVSLKTPFDYETMGANKTFIVYFFATDGVRDSAHEEFTIEITDVQGAPVISSPSSVSIPENTTEVMTVTASDDESEVMSYAIAAGDDGTLFSINSATGVLVLNDPKDFDDGTSNTLHVNLSVSDQSSNSTNQTVTVTITNVNEAPHLTPVAPVSLAEEQSTPQVTVLSATDEDNPTTLTYSISGGDDAGFFNVNATSGILKMNITPNRENPLDANGDNVYTCDVEVSDGALSDTITLNVTVTDINDNLPTFDGPQDITKQENIKTCGSIPASDLDSSSTITYSIVDGADQSKFSIDPSSGELQFISTPDYETPLDSDGDNVYELRLAISDGTSVEADFTVTVTDEISPQIQEIDSSLIFPSATTSDGQWSVLLNNNGADIYQFDGTAWVQHTNLTNAYKHAMVLKNNRLITSDANSGDIRIFLYDANSDSWTEEFSDTYPPGSTESGDTCQRSGAVSFNGSDTFVIGSSYDNSAQGKVYIYHYDGTTWNRSELTEPAAVNYNFFGCGVALEGSKLIVGAPWAENGANTDVGAAYIYVDNGTSWSLEHTIYGTTYGSRFGARVAIQNSDILVSEPKHPNGNGLVHYLQYNTSTDYTNTDITPADATAEFGSEIIWSSEQIAINAQKDKENRGAYYLYTQNGNIFTQKAKIVSPVIINNISSGVQYKGSFTDQFFLFGTHEHAYAYNYLASDELPPQIITTKSITEGGIFLGVIADDLQDGHATSSVAISISGGADASEFTLNTNKELEFKSVVDYEAPTDTDSDNIYELQITADDGTHTSVENVSIEVTNAAVPYVNKQLLYESTLNDGDTAREVIDVSGNYMIVGIPDSDDDGTSSGSAYIYQHDGTQWSSMQKLTASDAAFGDKFGTSVAIWGDYAVVGAYWEDTAAYNAGAAYLFYYNGTTWVEVSKMLPSGTVNSGDNFGFTVDIDANHIVVGAPMDDEGRVNSGGAVYLFTYDSSSVTLSDKLSPSELSFTIGRTVAVSGDTIVSSGYGLTSANDDQGMIIYTDTDSDGTYETNQTITNPNPVYGGHLDFDGSRIAVSDLQYGDTVYIYSNGPSGWLQSSTITGVAAENFGSSIAINGTKLLVGASGDNSTFANTGAVYVYNKTGSGWAQETKLFGTQNNANEGFGCSVSFGSGTSTFVFGACGLEIDRRNNGAVFSFGTE